MASMEVADMANDGISAIAIIVALACVLAGGAVCDASEDAAAALKEWRAAYGAWKAAGFDVHRDDLFRAASQALSAMEDNAGDDAVCHRMVRRRVPGVVG